jgi:hypothetical protein
MINERRKKALIVAVSDYRNSHLRNLDFCEKDGKEMNKVLESVGYDNLNLVGMVNHQRMMDAIWDFFTDSHLKTDDILIFYYSGHGIPDISGKVYLASSETDPDAPFRRGFSFDDLTDAINRSNSTKIVTILDCCYSGAAKIGKGRENVAAIKGATAVNEKKGNLEGNGRYLLAASQSFQEAYELSEKGNSIFTYYLLQGLKGNKDVVDIKGDVTPTSLGKYVYNKIVNLAEGKKPKQKPIVKAEMSGDFPLVNYPHLAENIRDASQERSPFSWKLSDLKGRSSVLTGKLTYTDTNQPLYGYTVKAFEKDPVFENFGDDPLGSSVTLDDGTFSIYFTKESFKKPGEFWESVLNEPDVYLKVFDPTGNLIHETPVISTPFVPYDNPNELNQCETIVVSSGFGGTIVSLSIANQFEKEQQALSEPHMRKVILLERGQWWVSNELPLNHDSCEFETNNKRIFDYMNRHAKMEYFEVRPLCEVYHIEPLTSGGVYNYKVYYTDYGSKEWKQASIIWSVKQKTYRLDIKLFKLVDGGKKKTIECKKLNLGDRWIRSDILHKPLNSTSSIGQKQSSTN